MKKRLLSLLLLLSFFLTACFEIEVVERPKETDTPEISAETDVVEEDTLDPDGYYTSEADVARYLHTYDELPHNYLTKSEARDLGWESSEGNLWEVTDQMLIGGDYFGNREGLLPEDRDYFEADVN